MKYIRTIQRPTRLFSISRIACRTALCLVMLIMPAILPAQQTLPKPDAETLKKTVSQTSEIERLIIRATPASLAEARSRIAASTVIAAPDSSALHAIIRGIERTVYGSSGAVPSGAQASARFEIPVSAEGADRKYITCLVALADVSAGKIPAVLALEPASALSELIGMLVFFSSTRAEIRTHALSAIPRFSCFDVVSIIPHLILGIDAFDAKRYLDAERHFSAALAIDRTVEPAVCGFARTELALGKPQAAKEAMDVLCSENALNSISQDFRAYYGIALYQLNQILDAEPWLEEALKQNPGRTDVLIPLAHAALQRMDYPLAARYLDQAYRTYAQDRSWLLAKSQLALENGRPSDAERYARSAVKLDSRDPVALSYLVRALEKSGDDKSRSEAMMVAESVLAYVRDSADSSLSPLEQALRSQAEREALRFLISESYRRQDWLKAAQYYQQAGGIPLDREMVAAILRKSGNVEEAIRFTTDWKNQEPNSEKAVEAWLRSLALQTGGSYASASTRTSDAGSGLGIALSALGSLKGESGNSPLLDIVVNFIAAPYSRELKSFLYYLAASLNTEESRKIEQLKNALAERADNVEALVLLAEIYANRYLRQFDLSDTSNRDKALRYISIAKSFNPKDLELVARIEQIESKLK